MAAPITTFIFDCFGVISDSVINGWYKKNRLDKGLVDKNLSSVLRRFDLGELPESGIVDYFLKYKEVTMTAEELRRDIDSYLKLNDGLIEMIRKLKRKGFKVVLLSNASNDFFERKVYPTYPEFKPLFDEIIISSAVRMAKPDKEIYLYALDKAGSKPEESLFIDDNAENVKIALDLGMQGLVFTDNAAFERYVRQHIGDVL